MGRTYNIAIIDLEGNIAEVLARFPSVTTVISEAEAKPALVGWAAKVGITGVMELLEQDVDLKGLSYDEVRKELKARGLTSQQQTQAAAKRGTAVHAYAEKLLTGAFDPETVENEARAKTPEDELGYIDALFSWYSDWTASGSKMHAIEQKVASLTHGYAGAADLLEEDAAGRLGVSDFKTSKAIYDSHFIQGSAYALAVEEMRARAGRPVTVDFVSVIRFGSDGEYEVKEQAPDPTVFLAMLALYKARNGRA